MMRNRVRKLSTSYVSIIKRLAPRWGGTRFVLSCGAPKHGRGEGFGNFANCGSAWIALQNGRCGGGAACVDHVIIIIIMNNIISVIIITIIILLLL